jgi:hypothetical protein
MRFASRHYLIIILISSALLVSACAGVIRPNDQAMTQAAMAEGQRAAAAAAMAATQASIQALTPPPR